MEISHREQHRFRLPAMLGSKQVALCALIIALLPAPPSAGTKYLLNTTTPAVRVPTMPDDRVLVDKGDSTAHAGKKKVCSFQPYPGMHDTVSVASLQIPPKAQKEFEEACFALKNKKLPESEKHLRKATEIHPNYVAGWVMLGEMLNARQQTAEARDACSRASSADPKYLPAYLCLAEVAGHEKKWHEVLNLTSRALELDPVTDAYAYFYSAVAYFNLNQLPEAEARALKAEVIDKDHHEPLIQFLLARIYEAKHDSAGAASHLQEYRKIVLDSQDADNGKKDSGKAHNPK